MNAQIDMPDGYFVTAAHMIGSTDEEMLALANKSESITPERKEVLAFMMTEAMRRLLHVMPEGTG